MSGLQSELLFELEFEVGYDPDVAEPGPDGLRMASQMTTGSFKGPRLSGKLADGGVDWIQIRNDGVGAADVRCKLLTDDGVPIYMSYRGYLHPMDDPVLIERMQKGEADPSEYYFRMTPYFETTAPQYEWLNRIVAVSVGRLGAGTREGRATVHYDVYEIK